MKVPPLKATYRFNAALFGPAPMAVTIGNLPSAARTSDAALATKDHGQKSGDPAGAYVPPYPRLEHVTRPYLTTAETAYYLNLKPQTLRVWACYESGPLRPMRLVGRLGWRTDQVRELLRVNA